MKDVLFALMVVAFVLLTLNHFKEKSDVQVTKEFDQPTYVAERLCDHFILSRNYIRYSVSCTDRPSVLVERI